MEGWGDGVRGRGRGGGSSSSGGSVLCLGVSSMFESCTCALTACSANEVKQGQHTSLVLIVRVCDQAEAGMAFTSVEHMLWTFLCFVLGGSEVVVVVVVEGGG